MRLPESQIVLLKVVDRPTLASPRITEHARHSPPSPVEIQGFPATFWIVTKPKPGQTVDDICCEVNILQFACMVRGGMDESTIHGIYVSGVMARAVADALLTAAGGTG